MNRPHRRFARISPNFLIGLAIVIPLLADSALAREVKVPDDYGAIQDAIDAIAADPRIADTVVIAPGTYSENLRLINGITLRGQETARTLLEPETDTLPIVTGTSVSNVTLRNLTFTNADEGIVISGGFNILLASNVFDMGNTAVAFQATNSTTATVVNNTFYDNEVAVDLVASTVTLRNNIFATNATAIAATVDAALRATVEYNCFYDNNLNGITGDFAVTDSDPLFALVDDRDFHLRKDSPCIDAGTGEDYIDGTDADMGAYGGEYADPLPFPVQRVALTDVSSTVGSKTIDVTWAANWHYLIDGYKLYYDSDKTGPPYEGTDAAGGTLSSPIQIDIGTDVDNVTSYRLENLAPNVVTPGAPTGLAVTPGDGRLTVAWQAVSGASRYILHYGINDIGEQTVDDITATSYTLHGLSNGATYQIAVAAVAQPVYHVAVTARYTRQDNEHESDYSDEVSLPLGEILTGPNSQVVSAIPEPVQPYPLLPNEGCFIATAAYGYYDAPQVRALRAFRDQVLASFAVGREFIQWYYAHSPRWASYIDRHPAAKTAVRIALWPAVIVAEITTTTATASQALWLLLVFAATIAWHRSRRRPS